MAASVAEETTYCTRDYTYGSVPTSPANYNISKNTELLTVIVGCYTCGNSATDCVK